MEYTDKELNKMIVKLEGWGYHDESYFNRNGIGSIIFDLMVKYKASINRDFDYIEIDNGEFYNQQSFKSESEIPRAIIICILKSKNII